MSLLELKKNEFLQIRLKGGEIHFELTTAVKVAGKYQKTRNGWRLPVPVKNFRNRHKPASRQKLTAESLERLELMWLVQKQSDLNIKRAEYESGLKSNRWSKPFKKHAKEQIRYLNRELDLITKKIGSFTVNKQNAKS
jgi:hypothetical protein